MCIFSQSVDHVGSTRIFVADLGHGVHATAYQMAFRATKPVAMILPIPVLKGTGDEAIAFIDLGGYDKFFDDLDRCFPTPPSHGKSGGGGYGVADLRALRRLAVHEVGNYVASYVPSIADFRRLDPCFRLPEAAWDTLPDYHDFGFAVFQLRPGQGMQHVHPIAYTYPAEHREELFFPTVHVHDGGRADPEAGFDHDLYFQCPGASPDRHSDLEIGSLLPARIPDIGRAQGLVASDIPLGRLRLFGRFPNADIVFLDHGGRTGVEARPARAGTGAGPRLTWSEFQSRRKGLY